ncbi:MAG: type II toxin-antitoxin system RelE/ParE family toxin [Nitrospirales bacterium]
MARQELKDAIRYYELEYSGLGSKFKEEVRKAVLRIVAFPQAWSTERGDVRKCLLHKFPYKLYVLYRRRSYSYHCRSAPTPETGLLG